MPGLDSLVPEVRVGVSELYAQNRFALTQYLRSPLFWYDIYVSYRAGVLPFILNPSSCLSSSSLLPSVALAVGDEIIPAATIKFTHSSLCPKMRSFVASVLLAASYVAGQGPETTAPAQLGALGIGLQGNGTNATGDGKYTISAEGIRARMT